MLDAHFENHSHKNRFESPEQEIAFLKKELERVALLEKEHKKENIAEEIASGIVESYKKVETEKVLDDAYVDNHEHEDAIHLKLNPEEHDSIIEELYSYMLDKGVKNALNAVARMGNPHVEDDFHRFLVQYLASHYEIPGLRPKTDLAKSLGLRMFEILLPGLKVDGKVELKEIATKMEQFIAGMQSIGRDAQNSEGFYYTLEIALPEGADHMGLFVSMPKERADLFEKQILGLFPDVRVTEIFDDYNIFSYSGVVSGSYMESHSDLLEFKTYEAFEHDTMKVLVNAFSKILKDAEGAAVQFVITPHGDNFIKGYGKALDNLKKGEPLKKAEKESSFMGEFGSELGNFFAPEKKEKKEKEDDKKNVDEKALASITKKMQSTIVRTNIRIISSAKTKQRSDDILHDLESAFQQYNNPEGNRLSFKRLLSSSLQDLTHQYIFRLFNEKDSLRLNLREIATLYHFPLGIKEASQLKQDAAKNAPAPSGVPQEGIILGKNSYRHRETYIHMSPEDRLRHFYVIGQTGTGKTHIMKSMIIQDIVNGDGVCFIDPHGSDIQDILDHIPPERVKDVVYFDPAYTERPMALNMLDYDPRFPEQKTFVINELMGIFNKLFDMKVGGGAMFEQYFRNAAGLVMEHPESGNTLLEIGRVLGSKPFRDMKLRYCKNPIIKQFWENAEKTTGDQGMENFVPYITSKFDVFISNEIMRPVVAQQKSSFNFREIMDEKKILLVNLSKGRLGEINANLIGMVLVGKILMAALSRVDSLGQKLPPFYLYIDEFQNVTTDSISQILSEARKYGLGLHIAHQFVAQLDEGIKNAVFGNVGSMASFRISFDDAQYLEKRFAPTFAADDIMRIPNRNAYLQMIGHGKPLTPFNISTLPLDFFAKKNPAGVAEKIKQLSYLRFGKERSAVESDILTRYA